MQRSLGFLFVCVLNCNKVTRVRPKAGECYVVPVRPMEHVKLFTEKKIR